MQTLNVDLRSRASLPDQDILAMFDLYDRYYAASSLDLFRHDLLDKDHVILLRDANRRLRGFSTVAVLQFEFAGMTRRAIFSGDTIIDHRYWGSQSLPLAWCRLAGGIKAEAPRLPLYWFLISKGHRTYRYLPLFAKAFYPSWRHPTPAFYQQLMDHLAVMRFGDAYDPLQGVVRFPQSHGHLRPEWAGVRPLVGERPDVRFFLEKNPGHAEGHELVCLTELATDNLRLHARRVFTAAELPDERLAAHH